MVSGDVRAEAKDNTMTDQELDAFVNSIVNPPLPPWSDRAIAMVMDAVRVADSNAVTIVQEILLTNRYQAEFSKAETEDWVAESSYLRWQQFSAVQAARRPDVFGEVLLAYYYERADLQALSDKEQIHKAALKLIQRGSLYTARLDAETASYDVPRHRYAVQNIDINGDSATVKAAFLKPLAGHGYIIKFRKVNIRGVDVWIPVEKEGTWIS